MLESYSQDFGSPKHNFAKTWLYAVVTGQKGRAKGGVLVMLIDFALVVSRVDSAVKFTG